MPDNDKLITLDNLGTFKDNIEEEIDTKLATKVDKVTGKGLSSNDFTDAEKTKLAGIESGAQVNTVTSVAGKTGAVSLGKSDVGLGNVDNTSDLSKPVSNATQTALNAKQDTLVSGTNIKTINGTGLLGSGNIEIEVESIPDSDIAAIFANLDPTAIYPVLEDNTWEVIKAVCEAGIAADYWSLGDTKTDVGTDGKTRTFRIADMQGLYGKHVVFEQVELESSIAVWNSQSNVDGDNCCNNYSISNVRTKTLPALLAKYSNSLQSVITNTKYKVATNGNNGTLLELEDKLFLASEREILGSRSYSRTEEFSALKRFQLYAANNTTAFRKKFKMGTSEIGGWMLRSPVSGYTYTICDVSSDGYVSNGNAYYGYSLSPFFSF